LYVLGVTVVPGEVTFDIEIGLTPSIVVRSALAAPSPPVGWASVRECTLRDRA
jgi:hypothetical protein